MQTTQEICIDLHKRSILIANTLKNDLGVGEVDCGVDGIAERNTFTGHS